MSADDSDESTTKAEQVLNMVEQNAQAVDGLSDNVNDLAEKVDRITAGSAGSSQIEGSTEETDDDEDIATKFAKALGGGRLHKADLSAAHQTFRADNREAMRKDGVVTTDDLSGPQLPRDLLERIVERPQRGDAMLQAANVEVLPRREMALPKVGVGRLTGYTRDEGASRPNSSEPTSGTVEFDATGQFYGIKYDLKEDAIKDLHQTEEEIGNLILNHFETQWRADVQAIALNAGYDDEFASEHPDLDAKFDGWLAILDGADPHGSDRIGIDTTDAGEVDQAPGFSWGGVVETELFNTAIQALPRRLRDPDSKAFYMNQTQVQQYHFELSDREDTAGVDHLYGDNPITPFSYDIVGVEQMPEDTLLLCDPENLYYGQYEEMAVEQQTETDKTMDEALHSRNLIEGQFDFQAEMLQDAVLVDDIVEPALDVDVGETIRGGTPIKN